MIRKLMIRTWFGDLPQWHDEFAAHVRHLGKYGWDFFLVTDEDDFRGRVRGQTGTIPIRMRGTRKSGDFDPMLGHLYPDLIADYDYWGHFNLDAVYGRLDRWIPDSFLQNLDIFCNDPGSVCGPFTVYRNCEEINILYRQCPSWKDNLTRGFTGWDELDFNQTVAKKVLAGEVTMGSGFLQSHDHITRRHSDWVHSTAKYVRIMPDGSLRDLIFGREVMMFHFNQSRRWPVEGV